MARRARVHVPLGHYHVTLRGNHQEALFASVADRRALDDIVADSAEVTGATVDAFCWMTNHLHLLVQIGEVPLDKLMQRISMRYARYRHSCLRTTGHLFERRYGARHVHDDAYFLTALRYIHRNPCAAGLATEPAAYPWSSHTAYLGQHRISWLRTAFGLSLFHPETALAREAYRAFVAYAGQDDPGAFAGPFPVESSVAPVGAVAREQALELIAREVCTAHGAGLDLIRGPSRARSLGAVRVEIARRAQARGGTTLGEVARFLGRDASALCQLLARHPKKPL